MIQKETSPASKAIIGTAILFLGRAIVHWSIAGIRFDLGDWIMIGGTVFLVSMGIWARWMPLPPAIITLAIYVGFVSLDLPKTPFLWVLHGMTLLLLVIAVIAAIRGSSARRNSGDRFQGDAVA
jgi:hypothetical protein